MKRISLISRAFQKRTGSLLLRGAIVCAFLSGFVAHAADPTDTLQIYFVDVEGGQATLFITPTGQSLLIDTGWPGHNARDAERIVAAAKGAGLNRIDYVLVTHYHDDHVGGVAQLVQRIPVGGFIDHGPNREVSNEATQRGWENYLKVLADTKYKHLSVKPGEVLPISGMNAIVVSSDGSVLDRPLPGAAMRNPYCTDSIALPTDQTENARSVGILVDFGKLKVLDLGDLTADKERSLMCPINKLGHVDVLIVSHHGYYQSSSPVLIDAIAPVVAIMDNGATKGGSIPVLDTLSKSPGLRALWQLHFSEEGGATHNTFADYIANLQGEDHANYIKLTASASGKYVVYNSRTQEHKSYSR